MRKITIITLLMLVFTACNSTEIPVNTDEPAPKTTISSTTTIVTESHTASPMKLLVNDNESSGSYTLVILWIY